MSEIIKTYQPWDSRSQPSITKIILLSAATEQSNKTRALADVELTIDPLCLWHDQDSVPLSTSVGRSIALFCQDCEPLFEEEACSKLKSAFDQRIAPCPLVSHPTRGGTPAWATSGHLLSLTAFTEVEKGVQTTKRVNFEEPIPYLVQGEDMVPQHVLEYAHEVGTSSSSTATRVPKDWEVSYRYPGIGAEIRTLRFSKITPSLNWLKVKGLPRGNRGGSSA